ncbi:MAG: tyrosine-type recombinase/integrase [Planctomycetes bacterium]|nr:tyrosine-type recombinase/integrase [Planctomycetota bacterium]
MATIFKRKGGSAWLIQYFDGSGRRREKSSRTTDRRAAERIAHKLEADAALRREGVIDGRQERFSEEARKPLAEHVEAYLEHCRGRNITAKSIYAKKSHLEWLMRKTRATRLSELTLDVVERALASLTLDGKAARTVNTRRESLRAFGNWCRKTSRVDSNPLALLPKLDEHRDRRRIRRPLTDDELARLLDVAGQRGRRAWYLTAALAGLRRSELIRLTWASVNFEDGVLTIRDGKAKREDLVPLHPELLEELKRIYPPNALPSTRVFPEEVTNRTRTEDFKRAGIELLDKQGRVADLHGLRATLGTRLARAGVAPQVAQRLMRHADYRTTLHHYTMLSLADTVAAMKSLPGGGATRPKTTPPEPETAAPDPQQIPQHSAHDDTQPVATSCRVGASGVPQPRAHKSFAEDDLCEATQRSAKQCAEDEPELLAAHNGLGNRRSILLSYGRIERARRIARRCASGARWNTLSTARNERPRRPAASEVLVQKEPAARTAASSLRPRSVDRWCSRHAGSKRCVTAPRRSVSTQ